MNRFFLLICFLSVSFNTSFAQSESNLLTLDRIYNSDEFRQERMPSFQWYGGGDFYLREIPSKEIKGGTDIFKFNSANQNSEIFLDAKQLIPQGQTTPISFESFELSKDESKILFFTNSERVWRSNTKGDYWVYDLTTHALSQLGKNMPPSSLMFAKFSPDNTFVAYVSAFNLYLENFKTSETKQLTFDGNGKIINGTFDWVYEEEFGCRDGFRWSPDGKVIAFWQLDASNIGTHHMINNTDSIYPKLIPLQYPKVGFDPSSTKLGLIDVSTGKISAIDVPGNAIQNYIPRIQWIQNELLMIQQINRKQNHLTYWNYNRFTNKMISAYEETEETWVDIDYPDVSSTAWGMYDLPVVNGNSITRMTEKDGWRHVYLINLQTGAKKLLTPGNYDIASLYSNDKEYLYFSASPTNSTQRYLHRVKMDGSGKLERITPNQFSGINSYKISPNAKYAIHSHSNAMTPSTQRLVRLPDHRESKLFVSNESFKKKVDELAKTEIRFFQVTTADNIEIDGRMILPPDFDSTLSYPVLFHVYGEPWGQVAVDSWVGLYERFLAQKGYVIIDMDNRGTPCLKGSAWRKSIYRKIGIINSADQAAAAKEILKKPYLDKSRTAVWGWSGGGSMTLNLMFRYPEIYTTGMSVAPVAMQLYYDNIYQERYMGLPQENMEDFIEGSPITYAKNLKGNLLLVHGTGDDNVHYQNAEALANELIKHNKAFDMMAYPNRSHGIYEGGGTTRHLYNLLTRYLTEHVQAGPKDPMRP